MGTFISSPCAIIILKDNGKRQTELAQLALATKRLSEPEVQLAKQANR